MFTPGADFAVRADIEVVGVHVGQEQFVVRRVILFEIAKFRRLTVPTTRTGEHDGFGCDDRRD